MLVVNYLIHRELIEPEQPVGLIEAVLAHQRRLLQHRQARVVGVHADITRVVDTPHSGLPIQSRRHLQDIAVALLRGSDNHLSRLSGRNKSWCVAILLAILLVLQHTLLDELHRLEHTLVVFLRREQLQRFFLWNLDVHTHSVGPAASLSQQLTRSTGNRLQVDVAIKVMNGTQVAHNGRQPFHRVVGIAHHPTRQEQPLDVVATIELHRDFLEFRNGECGTRDVVRPSIDAVGAVVFAIVCQHDLQQRDAAAVVGKRMADAHTAHGIAHHARLAFAHGATRRARHIVLRRLSQYSEFLEGFLCQHANNLLFSLAKIQKFFVSLHS